MKVLDEKIGGGKREQKERQRHSLKMPQSMCVRSVCIHPHIHVQRERGEWVCSLGDSGDGLLRNHTSKPMVFKGEADVI